MWICKFKIYDKNSKFREIIEESKVELFYYPINYYIKSSRYFFIAVGIVRGNDESKTEFFKNLRKLKKQKRGRKIELLEIEKDFFMIITSHVMNEEEKKYVKIYYNPAVIHYKPIVFHKDGWEEWEIASPERKAVEDLIEIGEKIYKFKLLKFYWRKLKNFGFLTLLPELTEKQEKALKLALEEGYYKYPRKISLDKLSKIAKLSFSTFQAHVRKAENKILSYVINLKK